MFGSSNPFGQSSSSSPFGSQTQSMFGQTNSASTNSFAPNPFGTSTPFGAQTGSSMFGGTSTGVFGQTSSASTNPFTPNPFGAQTGSSMFGGTSTGVFGQTNNTSNNPFAPKPFGTSTPFGAQTGSSMFGGTSTGVFGAPQASAPFGSSSQAFGNSTPAFGAPSASAFGSSPSPFGGPSAFGQKPLGFSTPQSSPFGSTPQQSQPAFGNGTFNSSNTPAFGASTTPALGATSTPAFGATSTPAFGASSTPAFSYTNASAFGTSSSPAFGASPTPTFGNSGTAFGNNAFGLGGGFGAPSTPGFGASSTPGFGASSTPAFGASSTPSFSFSSSPSFGQSTSAFAQSTQSPFGAQGAQASTATFGGQQGGSRVTTYAPTPTVEGETGVKLCSVSAMPVYKDKSHVELRWEDYQKGDKGGQLPGGSGFGVTNSQPSLFPTPPVSSQTSANPSNLFSSSTATNPFTQKTQTTISNFSSPFGQTTTPSIFGSTSSTTTSAFGSSPNFAATPSQSFFGSSTNHGFSSSPSTFNSAPAQSGSAFGQFGQNTNPTNNFSNPSTGLSNLFSNASSLTTSSSPFGSSLTTSSSPFGSSLTTSSSPFGSSLTTSSSPFGSSLTTSSSPFGQTTPAGLTSNQPAQPGQASGAFGFNGFGPTQVANTSGFTNGMGSFTQGNFTQVPASTHSIAMQPIPVTNPFGTLPALPQISISQGGNSPSIQYGISSLPVVDKPVPVRISPLLTSRHLLQRRVRPPVRKYRPGDDGPKVPFFSNEENSNTPKADALFIPRENPRALFIRPVEREKSGLPKDGPTPLQENGKRSNGVTNGANHENKNNGVIGEGPLVKAHQQLNGTHAGDKNGSHSSPSGADLESLLPKLHHAEYFTEPRIQELAAKERVNPGYCRRVRDFVVGRNGYGSIRFLEETDVQNLDLEMLVQFNNREVIVYMDESKKPPVGQGLNKPAEVTLLNIKCIDKKSGKQVKEGARLDKFKEMLKTKAEEQGAEFVSYDAVKGEWKFKVEHFSSYKLGDEDED